MLLNIFKLRQSARFIKRDAFDIWVHLLTDHGNIICQDFMKTHKSRNNDKKFYWTTNKWCKQIIHFAHFSDVNLLWRWKSVQFESLSQTQLGFKESENNWDIQWYRDSQKRNEQQHFCNFCGKHRFQQKQHDFLLLAKWLTWKWNQIQFQYCRSFRSQKMQHVSECSVHSFQILLKLQNLMMLLHDMKDTCQISFSLEYSVSEKDCNWFQMQKHKRSYQNKHKQ